MLSLCLSFLSSILSAFTTDQLTAFSSLPAAGLEAPAAKQSLSDFGSDLGLVIVICIEEKEERGEKERDWCVSAEEI